MKRWKLVLAGMVWVVALGCGGDDSSQLVRVDTEPPGDTCPEGGSVIHTGEDLNDNGTLEDDEIDATSPLCDAAVLVATVEEEPGENCEFGGTAVHSGTDDDGSGTLDDGEVDEVAYVCDSVSTILDDDVDVDSPLDVAALGLFTEVTGTIEVSGTLTGEISWPQLQAVGGDFRAGYAEYTSLDLPALESVGGELWIVESEHLEQLNLAALVTVGEFDVTGNDVLLDASAPLLESSPVRFSVGGNLLATSYSFPALISSGTINVFGNPELTEISFDNLSTVAGAFSIQDNPKLPCADATALSEKVSVGGSVIISDNDGC